MATLALSGNALAETGVLCSQTGMESVSTPRDHYQAGEVATINGAGYASVCDVQVDVERPDGVVESFTATTDLGGNFTLDYQVPPPPGVLGQYRVVVRGLDGAELASTTFEDAPAPQFDVAPSHVKTTGTRTFSVLVRNVAGGSGDTARCVRVITGSNFDVVSWSFQVANPGTGTGGTGNWVTAEGTNFVQIRNNENAPSGRGLLGTNLSDPNWVRFEITINVQATGTQAWRAWMNTSGTTDCTSGSSDDLSVRAGGIFTRDYAMDFRDASGNVIAAPSTTSGGTVDYRARVTRVNSSDDLSYAAIAVPTCLSNIAVVSVTDSGSPNFAAHVSDNFVRLVSSSSSPSFSGTKLAANGEWVQVHFTATAGCSSAQPFRSAAWKNTSPEAAEGDIYKLVPSVSINNVSLTEGNSGTKTFGFTVSLSHADDNAVSVNYATANGTAIAPLDYTTIPSTTLTFAPGETSKTVNVTVNGDVVIEPDETFSVNLTAPSNAFIADNQGVGTILNDDNSLSIDDVTLTEGNSGTKNFNFTVTLSPLHTSTVTVQYSTANGTATAGSDYVAHPTTTLTFTPGQTTKTVTVLVNGDNADEADETFFVNLFNSTNATITDSQGVGTILNDENEAPLAVADSYSTDEDTTLNEAAPGVLANDTDADGDTLTAALVDDVDNGTLDLEPDGSFSYTPNANFNGSDSFTYRANDGTVNSNVATVTITVDAVNDAPACEDVTLTTAEDTPGSTSPDCSDVEGDSLTYEIVDQPTNGTSAVVAGDLTYTPDPNFNGTDSFTYRASDGTASSNTANVAVTVNAVNDAPVANDDAYSTDEDTPLTVNAPGVLGNDSDVEGDALSAVLATGPTHGSLTLNADGSFSYTPDANYNGGDSFTYKANDGAADSNAATVSITVEAINDAPACEDVSLTTDEDTPGSTSPDCSDVDGDPLTYEIVDQPAHGTAAVAGGDLTYTPDANYNGGDSFTYRASDGAANSNTANVAVTVNAVNDAPAVAADDATVTVNEGQTATSTGTWSDPDAGDTVTLTASVGSVAKNADGTWSWSYTTTDGPAQTQVVTITADDGTTSTQTTFQLNVDNVAPTASFTAPASVTEGSSIALSLTAPSDPSSVDTEAGFEYRFSCDGGATWTAWSSTGTASCSTNDNGTKNVKGQIRDKDGGTSTYSASVTVDNVAPTATFNAPASVNEGSAITISLSSPSDPSSVDTTAGFAYRFSCDNGNTWTAWGPSTSHACPTTDNGTRHVKGEIRDKDGGVSTYAASVTVNNVAPSATFNAPESVNEGSDINISLSNVVDPGTADTHEYRFKCGAGDWTAYGTSASHSCATTDNGTVVVKGQVRDDDGGESEIYSASVTVNNVAPSATFNAPESVNEGSDINISLSNVVDPGTADTHEYRFSCDGGETWTAWSASASHACATNDDGTVAVRGQVRDDDGGTSEAYSDTVTVDNVAPTATFDNNGPVNEGSDINVSLTDVVDPGTADTHEFRFSCDGGTTWTGWSSTASHSCATNDNGTRSVKGQVRDDDGGESPEYSASVTVTNVAPTATFNAPDSVSEGSSIDISLTNPSDPSSADTAAGFDYRFSCDNGDTWTDWGTSNEHSCPTTDNGTRNVKGEIRDKDGGVTTYSASVTVTNVAPSATFNAPESVNEGSDINLSLTDVVDPGSADSHEYRFSCDGGTTWTDWGNSTHACPTNDNGTVEVRGQVRDDDGGTSEVYSDSVTVNNVAPTATFNAPESVNEGSNIEISLSNVVDPGTADTHQFRFSCDGGTTWTDWSTTASHSCSTNDNGTRSVKGQVRDDDGGTSAEYSASVTVNNVAPTATFNAPESVNEGSNINLSLTDPSDPSSVDTAAGFEYRFSCDNGASWTLWSPSNTHVCPTNDSGTKNVKGEIRDKDGGTTTYSDSVTVNNVAPTATFTAPPSVNEGSEIVLSMTAPSDPSSADTAAGFTYAFDCGDGAGYGAYSSSNTRSCPTTDNGTRNVGGKIRDKDGGVTEYTGTVTVNNVPPTLTSLTPSSYLVLKGSSVSVTGTYTDPGTGDTFTCIVNWDEPTGTPENVAGGPTSCTASHTYTVQGTYSVSMKVRDDDGAESNTLTVIITVYDPSAGGFVTGGGWINSPAGSYAADPTASGRANFGFNSQYKKGASVPTGETEFQLHFATFKFHSEAYEVLVVSGHKAQYRGTGKVNGVSGYRFVLTAYDGQITGGGGTDRFRIKISRIVDGVVVYDTKMGVSEDMDLAEPLAIGGGQIVIHKPK